MKTELYVLWKHEQGLVTQEIAVKLEMDEKQLLAIWEKKESRDYLQLLCPL